MEIKLAVTMVSSFKSNNSSLFIFWFQASNPSDVMMMPPSPVSREQVWVVTVKKKVVKFRKNSESNCLLHTNAYPKGQLISNYLFGVFNFLRIMNINKLNWGIIGKSNLFVHFFGRMVGLKKSFLLCLTFK